MATDYILCAAVHYDNGLEYRFQKNYGIETGFVLCGYMHPMICDILPFNPYYLKEFFDIDDKEAIQKYEELNIKYGWQEKDITRCKLTQGFITNKGIFVNRKEAYKIALNAGQIDGSNEVDGELFSEDLYLIHNYV